MSKIDLEFIIDLDNKIEETKSRLKEYRKQKSQILARPNTDAEVKSIDDLIKYAEDDLNRFKKEKKEFLSYED